MNRRCMQMNDDALHDLATGSALRALARQIHLLTGLAARDDAPDLLSAQLVTAYVFISTSEAFYSIID